MAGKWVRCKHCGSTLEVPAPSLPARAEPAPVPRPRAQEPPTAKMPPVPAQPTSTPRDPAPIPEAILLPDTEPQVPLRPQQTVRPSSSQDGPLPAARPAADSLLRPIPQPSPQPLRPVSLPAQRRPAALRTPDDSSEKKVIVFAASAVGVALVIILLATMLGGSSDDGRQAADDSSSRHGRSQAAGGEAVVIDFSQEPSVKFGPARVMSSRMSGVEWKEIPILGKPDAPGVGGRLWVYLPSGSHEPETLSCVLIGPAGSQLVCGMGLSEDNQAEHYPYVQEGFAVVAFEIDGALPEENPPDEEFRKAYRRFIGAAAGVANAKIALQYATTQIPEVDRERVFVAGHSSAGTVALLCAEHVDQLAGCVAFAPCSDLEGYLSDFVDKIDGVLPDVRRYMKDGSPRTYAAQLGCPVMIFHAIDDDVVKLSESASFAAIAAGSGHVVALQTAPRGGHFDAMIDTGIPEAITWMRRTERPASGTRAGAGLPPSPRPIELPSPVPGFLPPPIPELPMGPSFGSVHAYVHFQVLSYPSAGNAEVIARNALRMVVWAEPDTIRIDRAADELIVGVRVMSFNTNTAKLRLEEAGFVIGTTRYEPVRDHLRRRLER